MWINMRGAKGGTRGELNEAEFVAQPPSAVVARRRERATAGVVAEMLERRQLLSTVDPSTVYWSSINPQLLALTIQAEQADPRYAMLFNADLAALGVEPPGVWVSQHPQRQSVASSALARAPAHPKTPAHGPASHKPKVHKPKAHKPKFHKPAVHSPHSAIGNPQSALGNSPHSVLSTRPSVPRGSVLSTQSPVLLSLPRPTGGFLGTIHFRPFVSTPPTVTSASFVYDISALPQQVVFTFNEDVASSSWSSAVTITNLSTGNALTPSSINYSNSGGTYKLTINLATGASIPDGNYVATLNGSLIYDSTNSSNKLTGSDGIQGDPYNYSFFLLAGDCNHDGIVNNSDYFTLNHNYGQNVGETWSKGDFNYDGGVGADDYALQQHNYGENLSLGIPSGVQLGVVTPNTAFISWNADSDPNVTAYDVLRNGTAVATAVTATSYTDANLNPNSSYTYTIEGANSIGQFSPPSHPAVTPPSTLYLWDAGNGYGVGHEYDLTASFAGTPGDTVGSYVVAWGDGSAAETYTGTTSTFTHTYGTESTSAPYSIGVTPATNSEGTFTTTLSVDESPPTLSLTGGASVAEGSAYSLGASIADGDTGESYSWQIDWGDGTDLSSYTSAPGTFSYTYSEPGAYTVTAIVNDADDDANAGDIQTAIANISEATPGPSFSARTATLAEGTDASFADTFSDPGGLPLDNLSIAWGDGQIDAYLNDPVNTDHTYAEAGTYTATATFSDEDNTYTATAVEHVSDVTPGFTLGAYPSSVNEGDTFTLGVTFTDGGSSDVPTGYYIAWGDGQTSSYGSNPKYNAGFTHVYTEPATDTISVTATTDDGTFSATRTEPVAEGAAGLQLIDPAFAVVGQPYSVSLHFSDPGQDAPSGYVVAWNDGNAPVTYGPTQTLVSDVYSDTSFGPLIATASTEDNSYIVNQGTLTLLYQAADSFTASGPSAVAELATATFSASFGGQSPNYVYAWAISYGDGSSGTDYSGQPTTTFDHAYSEPGTYRVAFNLEEYEPGGPHYYCGGISYMNVTVTETTPTLTVTGDSTATVVGDTYTIAPTYTDNGNVPNGAPIAGYRISWGDGTSELDSK